MRPLHESRRTRHRPVREARAGVGRGAARGGRKRHEGVGGVGVAEGGVLGGVGPLGDGGGGGGHEGYGGLLRHRDLRGLGGGVVAAAGVLRTTPRGDFVVRDGRRGAAASASAAEAAVDAEGEEGE